MTSLYCATMATEPKSEDSGDEHYPKPRPEGEPAGVVKLRELIEEQLTKMFERYFVNEQGNYVLGLDTARVFVVPTWLEDEQTVIRIFAITNLDVPVTAELTKYLLAKNLEFVLGAFALDAENGAVWFNHNLLGEFMAARGVRVLPRGRRPDRGRASTTRSRSASGAVSTSRARVRPCRLHPLPDICDQSRGVVPCPSYAECFAAPAGRRRTLEEGALTEPIRPGDNPNELLVFDHGFVRLDDAMATDLRW